MLITIDLILVTYKTRSNYGTNRKMYVTSLYEKITRVQLNFDVYSFMALLTCHMWLINPSGRCDKLTYDL